MFGASAAGILQNFNPGLYLREFEQPNAKQEASMMTLWKITVPFLKSKILIRTLCHIFYLPKLLNSESDFISSVLQNKKIYI